MIDIRDLVIRYPDTRRPAVDGLTLSIGAGEVFGFVGPNGAGKTSTLKVLCGLVRAASGTVRVAGVDVVAHPADVRRRVGYLPDFFGVYPDLTCREYLTFFAAAQGLAHERRAAVVEEVLQLVDLAEKADQLAGILSRGMQQRLGLARVLVHEPEVLLLDEPASGLDPRARIEIREVLRELGSMGKTVILSSHVLADLEAACTTIGIIEEGRLVHAGSVKGVLAHAAASECDLRIGCAEGPERAQAALTLDEAFAQATFERIDGMLRVAMSVAGAGAGAEAAREDLAARAASRLLGEGLRLTHLEIERADLERAFMALTEGRLA